MYIYKLILNKTYGNMFEIFKISDCISRYVLIESSANFVLIHASGGVILICTLLHYLKLEQYNVDVFRVEYQLNVFGCI